MYPEFKTALPDDAPFIEFVIEAYTKFGGWSRFGIIEMLQWNDPNGIHTDVRAIAEGIKPYTKPEAIQKIAHFLCPTGQPNDFKLLTIEEIEHEIKKTKLV